jgi:3-oxoacyl-[acyl-carrier-protein] synthase II
MNARHEPVAVTGLGIVSPLGHELGPVWQRLMGGDSAISALQVADLPPLPAATTAFDAAHWLSKMQLVGCDRVSQLAVVAARLAVADAGLEPPFVDPARVGIYLGTGMGGSGSIETGYQAIADGRRMPPLTVPASMTNAAAAQVALALKAQGPVLTYAVACASSAVAIAEAAHALRRGDVDIALAAGAEALLVRGTLTAWHALRALAPLHDEAARSCRPFAPDRAGLVLGEGAACLVLERAPDARDRGRVAHAWLSGSGISCDAHHLTQPEATGQARAIHAALRAAGLQPSDIGYCNPHGTGTPTGDPVECAALRTVWGADAPSLAVGSTKAAHGHLLGAAGAMEAVWATLALQRGEIPPTAGLCAVDAACTGLDHVGQVGRRAPALRHALSNSFAFGGTNVALVFSRSHDS